VTASSTATLHITNGDSVLYLFKKSGIVGTHVAWRDALNEGPVPAGLSLEKLSAVRVGYLAERGYGSPIKLIREFESRDALVRRAGEFAEVVLWFEHDLYDQLQILQVLTAIEDLNLEPGRVALIQSDHYLGTMTVEEISPLLPRRRTATAAAFKSARRAWERVTSESPLDLYAAAQEDAIGLPYLRAAMIRLCEEYPLKHDGLSRSQRQALQAVAQGPAPAAQLFERAQAREEASFLGDSAFDGIVRDLRADPGALIEGEDGALALTVLGRRVLTGDANWLESRPIDRWIGGVHLTPDTLAYWDEDAARFVDGT
jgi:hypothetical protein